MRPEHLYKAIGLFFLLFFFYRFFQPITQTLLLIYAAAILAIALNPVTALIPVARKWVAALVGLLVFAVIGTILWFGLPALINQIRGFATQAPVFQSRLEAWGEWLRMQTGLNISLIGEHTRQIALNMFQGGGSGELLGRARGLLEILLVPLIVLIGGLYALANPNQRLLLPLLRAVPADLRMAFYRIFQLLGDRILGWVRGTMIAMLAVGLLSTVALYLVGVPYWLLLGVIIGVTEFIPLVGPWLGGVPAVLIAFLDDPMKGLWTALAILVIQQIESNLITPWAMSTAADVHPLVTLFALIFFGSVFGFLGILLAVPLVIFFSTVVQVLWVERAIDTDQDWLPPVVKE